MRRPLVFLVASLFGCTFAGLADYETPECNPDAPLADDGCNQLNAGNASCQRYQCDRASKRCVMSVLDEDRDGDPSVACGGTDCDDRDPKRSGKTPEVCDGIDNDCNGVIVARPPSSSVPLVDRRTTGSSDTRVSSSNGRDTYTTYLGTAPRCVHGFMLGDPDSVAANNADAGAAASCVNLEAPTAATATGIARQPELFPVVVQSNSTSGIAFIEEHPAATSGCATESLAFSSRASGRTFLADCGATLPALVSFPNLAEALIAFYDARSADRADPIASCAAAKPSPLKLRWVDRPTSDTPDLTSSAASTLGNSTSVRPPALLALEGGTAVLLASPFELNAGLWALTPDARIIPLATSIPALADARSVALAVGRDQGGSTSRLAMVAERGCRPAQNITMVLRDFDIVSNAFVGEDKFTEVAIATGAAGAPSVTWISAQREWWVTWVTDAQKAMLRRVAADGHAAEDPIEIGPASAAAIRAVGSGSVADAGTQGQQAAPQAFLLRPDGNAIDEVGFACK